MHVQEMTNVCVRLRKDVFLNCMTVQVATELSSGLLFVAYLFVFSQQMLRYNCVFFLVSKNHSS